VGKARNKIIPKPRRRNILRWRVSATAVGLNPLKGIGVTSFPGGEKVILFRVLDILKKLKKGGELLKYSYIRLEDEVNTFL
jgi:hypothetical protein